MHGSGGGTFSPGRARFAPERAASASDRV